MRWSRYYESGYEPATFEFLRANCRPGATALDIGAHLGLFSVVLGRLAGPAGKVFSFEPTPFTRSALETTIRLNGLVDRVEVRAEAVARKTGTALFHDTGNVVSNANSLVATSRSSAGIEVPTISIDEFSESRGLKVDLLKIDVEGAECAVLQGARQVITGCRPAVNLALHPHSIRAANDSLEEIWELLAEYRMHVTYGGVNVHKKSFCARDDLFDVQLVPA
jgi:FkbM family methyltransferase